MRYFIVFMVIITLMMITPLIIDVYEFQHSPFNPSTQEETLLKVAEIMDIELDPYMFLPFVLKGNQVTDARARTLFEFDVGSKRSNLFYPSGKLSVILLSDDAKIHNLAHEYVHYLQIMYRFGGDLKIIEQSPSIIDELEGEAIRIQKHFR